MAKEEIEHKKRRYLIIVLMSLLVAFLAVIMAQNAQDTADINNVFAPFLNNTNLAPQFPGEPTGTGERVSGVTYWANDSPIWLMAFSHANTAAQTAGVTLFINGTMVEPSSGKPLGAAEEANKSVVGIIPKGSNYSVVFNNYHHYEWREYPILSGKNGTLNVTQILNASGDFIPYLGANKNVTVGVNNFTIFSMDGNSSIYLPNTTHNGILIQQYQNAAHTQEGSIYINGTIQMGILNGVLNQNATYRIGQTEHAFRINDTDKAVVNKNGLIVSNITSVGINNGNYPNNTINDTIIRNYTIHTKIGSFTRDVSLASGTQAVTGVGFKPSSVEFKSIISGNVFYSDGFDTITNKGSVFRDNPTVNPDSQQISTGSSIIIRTTGTPDQMACSVQSFDDDGFTITCTKTNSPTGTATILYQAHR